MRLKPKAYKFKTSTQWLQARKGVLLSDNKKPIEIACPPEFGGHHGYWTAEHLFVASIEICIMTTFKWLIEKSNCKLITYKSKAVGKAHMVNNDFQFNEVAINPIIVVSDDGSLVKAKEAIKEAHKQCLISKALNFRVKVNPVIKTR